MQPYLLCKSMVLVCFSLLLTSLSFCQDSTIIFPDFNINTLTVHPLGQFMSRQNPSFKTKPTRSIYTHVSNANVWLPRVVAYKPTDPEILDAISKVPWHKRQYIYPNSVLQQFNQNELSADGVFRNQIAGITWDFRKNHEVGLQITLLGFDKGKIPNSIWTNDKVIEFVHSNIAGGEDPFARKLHDYNQAEFYYQDIEGQKIHLTNGFVTLSNVVLRHQYFPTWKWLNKRNIQTNLNSQIGINTSSINKSIDAATAVSVIKTSRTKNKRQWQYGLNTSLLFPHLLRFEKQQINITNKPYILSYHAIGRFSKQLKNKNFLSVALLISVQNSYYKTSEYDQIILVGERDRSHWHMAIAHLYKPIEDASLVISYHKKKWSYHVYLKEDIYINNAPDVQTGMGFVSYL